MSLGSAASLPGTMPQAPLSPQPTVRDARPFTAFTQTSGVAPPPRRLPLQRAADEPPVGRVLVVEAEATVAMDLQRLLRNVGYRVVGPASAGAEADRLVDRTFRAWPLDCALLDVNCPDAAGVGERLRSQGVPVVWMVPRDTSAPVVPFAAPILRLPTGRAALLEAIRTARREATPPRCYVTPPPQEAWPRIFPQL